MGVKTRVSASGHLEGVDEDTGEVVWVEKKNPQKDPQITRTGRPRGRPRKDTKESTFHEVMGPDGKLHTLPKGVSADILPRYDWVFSLTTCDLICEQIALGKTLRQVGMTVGFPTHKIMIRWLSDYPEFKRRYEDAKVMRAEYHRDRMLEHADAADAKSAPAERLRVETHRFMAEKDDPNTYGPRQKIVGDVDQPLTFVISTGIRREEPKEIAAEATPQVEGPTE